MVAVQLNVLDAEAVGGDSEVSALVALVTIHPAAGHPSTLHIFTFLDAGDSSYRKSGDALLISF